MTRPGHVSLIGAGPGDPELMTLKAARLLRAAQVVVFDRLVSPEILAMAAPDARLIPVGKAPKAHPVPQTAPLMPLKGGARRQKARREGVLIEVVVLHQAQAGAGADLDPQRHGLAGQLASGAGDLELGSFLQGGRKLTRRLGLRRREAWQREEREQREHRSPGHAGQNGSKSAHPATIGEAACRVNARDTSLARTRPPRSERSLATCAGQARPRAKCSRGAAIMRPVV